MTTPRAILSPSSFPTSRRSGGGSPTTPTSPTRACRPPCSAPPASRSRCCSKARPGVGKTAAAQALAAALDTRLVRLQCYEGIDSTEALYEWNYARQLLGIRLAEARGRGARRRRPVHPRVPRRTTAAERAASPRPAAGGAAGRRGRPRRRRVRGVPVRTARRVVGDDPRARHPARRVPADRRADVEPHPRPARRAQASVPVPLDRLPGPGTRQRDHPHARACGDARRSPTRSPPPSSRLRTLDVQKAPGHRRGDRVGRRPARCSDSRCSMPRRPRSRSGRCSSTATTPSSPPPARSTGSPPVDPRRRRRGRPVRRPAAPRRHRGHARTGRALAAALAIAAPSTTNELYWLARVTVAGDRNELATFDAVFAEVFRGLVDVADSRGAPEQPRLPPAVERGDRRTDAATDAHGSRPGRAAASPARRGPRWSTATTSRRAPDRRARQRARRAPPARLRIVHARGAGAPAPPDVAHEGRHPIDVRVGGADVTRGRRHRSARQHPARPPDRWRPGDAAYAAASPSGAAASCCIADVSGSMEAYSRAYLYLLHGAVRALARRDVRVLDAAHAADAHARRARSGAGARHGRWPRPTTGRAGHASAAR